jgi:heptosyltransferase-2
MNEAPESVLVLRFSALGDVVLTAPALEALHLAWPKTRIRFAVKARYAHLVEHNPHVNEVIPLAEDEGPWHFSQRLKIEPPSAILDLHNKIRSKLLRGLLPGEPRSVWHKRDWSEVLPVKLALRPYHASMPFADRYHLAVESLVGEKLPRGRLRYFPGPNDIADADRILREANVVVGSEQRPILGLSPGANWETKRWPAERFGEVAARALAAGVQVVVQGSEAEKPFGAQVTALAPGAVDLCGKLDLRALGGFLARCSAFVCNDSGPMHMSRGLGVPTVALFGSTDPKMFEFEGHRVHFANVPCSPCSFFGRRKCPQGHFACMKELDAESVWRSVEQLLKAGPRTFVSA